MLKSLIIVWGLIGLTFPALGFWEFLEDENNWVEAQEIKTKPDMESDLNLNGHVNDVHYASTDEELRSGLVEAIFKTDSSFCSGTVVGMEFVIAPASCVVNEKGEIADQITFDPGLSGVGPRLHREYATGVWVSKLAMRTISLGGLHQRIIIDALEHNFAVLHVPAIQSRQPIGGLISNTRLNHLTHRTKVGHKIEINSYSNTESELVMKKSLCQIRNKRVDDLLIFDTNCDAKNIMLGAGVFDKAPSGNNDLIGMSMNIDGKVSFFAITKTYLDAISELMSRTPKETSVYTHYPLTFRPYHRIFMHNDCDQDLYVAIRYGVKQTIQTKGWLVLPPQSTKEAAQMTSRYAHYFAQSIDGSHTWDGPDSYLIESKVNLKLNMKSHDSSEVWGDSIISFSCNQ